MVEWWNAGEMISVKLLRCIISWYISSSQSLIKRLSLMRGRAVGSSSGSYPEGRRFKSFPRYQVYRVLWGSIIIGNVRVKQTVSVMETHSNLKLEKALVCWFESNLPHKKSR